MAQSSKPSRDVPLPIVPPAEPSAGKSTVVQDGAINEARLADLIDQETHNPNAETQRKLKDGFQAAAVFQTQQGDPEGAIQSIDRRSAIFRMIRG